MTKPSDTPRTRKVRRAQLFVALVGVRAALAALDDAEQT
jgi:hypothetical protein